MPPRPDGTSNTVVWDLVYIGSTEVSHDGERVQEQESTLNVRSLDDSGIVTVHTEGLRN